MSEVPIISISATLVMFAFAYAVDQTPPPTHIENGVDHYRVAEFNFHHVETPIMITLWMVLASLFKIAFYFSPKPSSYVPESCMLILLGVIAGMVLYFSQLTDIDYTLSTTVFFLFLLPPIVLDAGYFMPRRPFFQNLGTILVLAVFGTLWNTLALGFTLYGLSETRVLGFDIPLMHCLLFAALISAVDPVAILAVFEDAHVNENLNIIVFGESLLNDGVAVVLYNMFGAYSRIGINGITNQDIGNGILSFFVVAFVGTMIGIIFGLFTGWLTKYTEKVRIIEPIFVFLLAYLSYLVSDMFKLSGILAIVFCGLIMRKYVEANIAVSSVTTVKYTMKTLSSMCESIIFLFLGLSTVVDTHKWNTAFTLLSLLFCILYRALGVLFIIPIMNRYRLVKLDKVDMFILIYGGLRGAISFSLALLLDEKIIGVENRRMFLTTTTAIVIFTSFFQVLEYVLLGVEEVMGSRGSNRLRERFAKFESKYLSPYLMKDVPKSRENKLLKVCQKLNFKEANAFIQQYGGDLNALKSDLGHMSQPEPPPPDTPMAGTRMDLESKHDASEKWKYLVGEMIHKRPPRVSRYSRHMIFDEEDKDTMADLTALQYRYQAKKFKAARPMIEPKFRNTQPKTGSKKHTVGDAIRRFSLRIMGSEPENVPVDETNENMDGESSAYGSTKKLSTINSSQPKLYNIIDQLKMNKKVGFENTAANFGDEEDLSTSVNKKHTLQIPSSTTQIPTITLSGPEESLEDEQVRRHSLTLAEKTLPWKTPPLTPLRMVTPPRKMSDVYMGHNIAPDINHNLVTSLNVTNASSSLIASEEAKLQDKTSEAEAKNSVDIHDNTFPPDNTKL